MALTNTGKVLASYKNGNTEVTILEDGTKIRRFPESGAVVEHPESIDLKITDWCDAGCKHCHESSTIKGKHAKFSDIQDMLGHLPPGVEIAIGGGDPFSHPELASILEWLKAKKFISNITVNGAHVEKHRHLITQLRFQGLFLGLGISYVSFLPYVIRDILYYDKIKLADDNTIIHFIAGVDTINDLAETLKWHKKVLILGYKEWGRGKTIDIDRVNANLKQWRYWLPSLLASGHFCFDNLALTQLELERRLPSNLWKKHFMGKDGEFTMYVDAVSKRVSVNSTSVRKAGLVKLESIRRP